MVQTCDLTAMEGSEERQRDGNQFLTSFADVAGGTPNVVFGLRFAV